ncbi:hypothetical protein DXG03_006790 [Asterophora parasitica]|uniref:Uncharacterized protein n=1 Tax=Asterophora parasitica TaxID=117018 RepID=A0A9P7KES4_9AGAR|nr:hypothetical protein DXG03_006790 [Asterophora parasitica]
MSKRQLVPVALHSELTEYSSLLRALRASNTLDVTAHIANSDLDKELDSNDDDDDLDDEEVEDAVNLNARGHGEQDYDTDTIASMDFPLSTNYDSHNLSPSQTPGPSSTGLSRSGSQKRKREPSLSPPQARKRDTWTRWPLLIDDVHVPEWSLEDEIGDLATNTLKIRPRPPFPELGFERSNEAAADDLFNVGDEDADLSFLPHLTNAASNHLSTILALLVAHTPNRSVGLQNRIEPMGWRTVLDVLTSCDDPSVADLKIINDVKTRMEALYGPPAEIDTTSSDVLSAHRIQCSINAKEKLKARIRQSSALLSLPSAPSRSLSAPQLRKRSNRKVKQKLQLMTAAFIEEEEV